MKIHEIITEAEVTPYKFNTFEETQIDSVIEQLKEKCSVALSIFSTPIWRGFQNHTQPIVIADPSTGVRKSQNTTNYFTSLIDSSPYMKGWPKRSKSFICSTSNYAGEFGKTYAIFPVDNARIAVCPGFDIWEIDSQLPRPKGRGLFSQGASLS
jgi:hypothetical protein